MQDCLVVCEVLSLLVNECGGAVGFGGLSGKRMILEENSSSLTIFLVQFHHQSLTKSHSVVCEGL